MFATAMNTVGRARSDPLVQGAVHAESGRADALVPDAWYNASAAAAGAVAAAQPYTVAAREPPALAAAEPPALAAAEPPALAATQSPTLAQPSAVKPSAQPPAVKSSAQPPTIRSSAIRWRRRRRRVHRLCDHGQPMDGWLRLRQHHQLGAPSLSSQPAAASSHSVLQRQ